MSRRKIKIREAKQRKLSLELQRKQRIGEEEQEIEVARLKREAKALPMPPYEVTLNRFMGRDVCPRCETSLIARSETAEFHYCVMCEHEWTADDITALKMTPAI